ncbi:hypothetical protein, partial [Alistipes putredinis]|uniref:hypothetical protein n=1 Tax=Alistipes putredinis TaxID=28117 RepID=UPI003F7C3331
GFKCLTFSAVNFYRSIVYANINEKNLNTAAFGENSPKRTGNPGVFRIFAKLNQLLTALK